MVSVGGEHMEWLMKLSNAIDYIEANLDNEISYDEVAKIACLSLIHISEPTRQASNEYLPMSQGFHYPSIYIVAE